MFTMAVSRPDTTMPITRVKIAQYRCGSGSPSSPVFVILAAVITNQTPRPRFSGERGAQSEAQITPRSAEPAGTGRYRRFAGPRPSALRAPARGDASDD